VVEVKDERRRGSCDASVKTNIPVVIEKPGDASGVGALTPWEKKDEELGKAE